MFGLTQSPFILEEILDLHFNNCAQEVWEVSEKVRDNMYLDDMVTGGESINEVTKWKSDPISLFRQEGFRLHKWHSKETLSETKYYCNTTKLNFAKRQWGTKANETKIILILVNASPGKTYCNIPSINDSLGSISVCLLTGKVIYRDKFYGIKRL